MGPLKYFYEKTTLTAVEQNVSTGFIVAFRGARHQSLTARTSQAPEIR